MGYLHIAEEYKHKFKRSFIPEAAVLRKSILKYGNPQTTLNEMTFTPEIQQELRDILNRKYQQEAMRCLLDAVNENEFYRAFVATNQTYSAQLMQTEYERIASGVEDSLSKGKLIYEAFSSFYLSYLK